MVYDAMQAELTRSMTLSLKDLDKPYFISYTVDDGMTWTASATDGGLVNSHATKLRVPSVQVRVGDYKFDNTTNGDELRHETFMRMSIEYRPLR